MRGLIRRRSGRIISLMIRGVMVAMLLLLSGCDDDGEQMPTPDAGPENTFTVEVGEACNADSAPLCASGYGYCVASRCELMCREPLPLCPAGLHEVWRTVETTAQQQCYCAAD